MDLVGHTEDSEKPASIHLRRNSQTSEEDRSLHNCNKICEKNCTSTLLLCNKLPQNIWFKTITIYLLMILCVGTLGWVMELHWTNVMPCVKLA